MKPREKPPVPDTFPFFKLFHLKLILCQSFIHLKQSIITLTCTPQEILITAKYKTVRQSDKDCGDLQIKSRISFTLTYGLVVSFSYSHNCNLIGKIFVYKHCCYLRWLKTVSNTYIWIGRYNHCLSFDATIMVSKNCPIIGEHVVIIFLTQ